MFDTAPRTRSHAEAALDRASRALLGVIARSAKNALMHVTVIELRVLVLLRAADTATNRELIVRLRTAPSLVTDAVRSLLPAHLVEEVDPEADWDDRCIRITAHGRTLVDEITERRRHELGSIVAGFPVSQLGLLTDAFDGFADVAGEPSAEELLALGL